MTKWRMLTLVFPYHLLALEFQILQNMYIYIYIYFFFQTKCGIFFLSDLATRASYNMLPERLTYHGLRKQPTFRDAIRLVSRRNDIQATSAETPYC